MCKLIGLGWVGWRILLAQFILHWLHFFCHKINDTVTESGSHQDLKTQRHHSCIPSTSAPNSPDSCSSEMELWGIEEDSKVWPDDITLNVFKNCNQTIYTEKSQYNASVIVLNIYFYCIVHTGSEETCFTNFFKKKAVKNVLNQPTASSSSHKLQLY